MSFKAAMKVNRSLRSGRQMSKNMSGKRYTLPEIKKFSDLRSFFYEYSIFVGDLTSLPGVPSLQITNKTREAFLKAGRIFGDAKAIGNTIKNFQDGVQASDFEGAGERAFRRFGGRTTGRILMKTNPSSSPIVNRAARSVLGANLQKEFDKVTKSIFRSSDKAKKIAQAKGMVDLDRTLSKNAKVQKVIADLTEDALRQAYNFTPVKTGKLRSSLRGGMREEPVRGGSIPVGQVMIGGPDIDYSVKIEYGEGKGFNVGIGNARRYFPYVPEYAQSLRSSKNNRRAVNANTGKGAMLRRGSTLAIQKLESSGLGSIATDITKTKNFDAVVRDALRMRTF